MQYRNRYDRSRLHPDHRRASHVSGHPQAGLITASAGKTAKQSFGLSYAESGPDLAGVNQVAVTAISNVERGKTAGSRGNRIADDDELALVMALDLDPWATAPRLVGSVEPALSGVTTRRCVHQAAADKAAIRRALRTTEQQRAGVATRPQQL